MACPRTPPHLVRGTGLCVRSCLLKRCADATEPIVRRGSVGAAPAAPASPPRRPDPTGSIVRRTDDCKHSKRKSQISRGTHTPHAHQPPAPLLDLNLYALCTVSSVNSLALSLGIPILQRRNPLFTQKLQKGQLFHNGRNGRESCRFLTPGAGARAGRGSRFATQSRATKSEHPIEFNA
jgi:hypothetical protein